MRRRTFLTATALTGLTAGLGATLTACGGGGGNVGRLSFTNRLRVPPLLHPDRDAAGVRRFDLRLRTGRREFRPGEVTETWGINGAFLGPTLRAGHGDRVAMRVANRLPETTTVHWHGMRLPARMDGGPHQPIEPGTTWSPAWTIDQPAGTLWYHPHPHGETAKHVYKGLAGMFILDDPESLRVRLPHRYGVDDVPLIVADRLFSDDGDAGGRGREIAEDAVSGSTFGLMGQDILVNGTYDPYFEVTTERVRFRVLNGSNARMYHLGFADDREFQVVATDSGLLPSPAPATRVRLSPGERVEIVVEFRPGESVVLNSPSGDEGIDDGDFDLLRLTAASRLRPSPEVPAKLSAHRPAHAPPGARVRRFKLSGTSKINGREMDMARIDEVVPAGAREIWEITNNTFAHSFHIHEVGFRVLDSGGEEPPGQGYGRKDTVFVPSGSTVRLAVEFGTHTDPRTPYMYHCHILRHEDGGMMGQFVLVPPGTDAGTPVAPGHRH